jgi:predicted secreted protein
MMLERYSFLRLPVLRAVTGIWLSAGFLIASDVMVSKVMASEGASLSPIGFSPDGRYFAFEQYGIHDDSGYPYWDVFVTDLETGKQAANSPVSVEVEDPTKPIAAARIKVRKPANDLLDEHGVTEPYTLLAATPATQVVPDRRSVVFERWYTSQGAAPNLLAFGNLRFELRVDDLKVPKSGHCDPSAGPYPGFELKIRDFERKQWRTLYTDDGLPVERGCARSYDLAAVVAQAGKPKTDRLVAIIGVYRTGFGGTDHRFIAVPFMLPK